MGPGANWDSHSRQRQKGLEFAKQLLFLSVERLYLPLNRTLRSSIFFCCRLEHFLNLLGHQLTFNWTLVTSRDMGGMSHCPYLAVSKLSHAVGQSVVPWQGGTCLKFSDKVLSFPWSQGANGLCLRVSEKL